MPAAKVKIKTNRPGWLSVAFAGEALDPGSSSTASYGASSSWRLFEISGAWELSISIANSDAGATIVSGPWASRGKLKLKLFGANRIPKFRNGMAA